MKTYEFFVTKMSITNSESLYQAERMSKHDRERERERERESVNKDCSLRNNKKEVKDKERTLQVFEHKTRKKREKKKGNKL